MAKTIPGSWEYETAKGHVVVDLLRKHVGGLRGKRILEVGPSTGALMSLLDGEGAEVSAVDIVSEWSDHYAYKPEKRRILNLESEELPPDMTARYDVVIAQEVIEHIRRPFDFLERVKAAMVPAGVLFLTTPNLVGITAWLKGDRWAGVATPTHYILYSPLSLAFTLSTIGFKPMAVFANLIPIATASGHPLLCRINRLFAPLKLGGGLMGFFSLK